MTGLDARRGGFAAADLEITEILERWSDGDEEALDLLIPRVYEQLHRIASRRLSLEAAESLQTTGLVHEVYLRLVGQRRAQWESRGHFFAIAARMMRRLLVDRARRRHAAKREPPPAEEFPFPMVSTPDIDLLALDVALDELASRSPRQARVVDLRHFLGLTIRETADALGLSERSVGLDWTMARAWLHQRLASAGEGTPQEPRRGRR